MPVKRCGEVLLSGGHEWSLDHSCRTANRVLVQLVTQNPDAIAELVLPAVGIDPRTRQVKNNLVPVDEEGTGSTVHDRNWINKALAMELLAATLLTCLDDPVEVRSPCVTDEEGRPKTYAQGDNADALATYPSFGVVVEVSSKKDMELEQFETQLKQGIKHGSAMALASKKPVYVLVINDCDIEGRWEREVRKVYHSLLPIEAKWGDVRPIPMSSVNFVDILDRIHPLPSEPQFRYDSLALDRALKTVYARLSQAGAPLEPGWTANSIVKSLRRAPSQPGLGLGP